MKYLYVVTSSSLPLNCWCMEFASYYVGCYFVVAQMPSGGVGFTEKPRNASPIWTSIQHTYLAQEIPWSIRRFSQGEAFPLHSGWADPCDHPKCGWLGCAIFVSGGLRSRYPLIKTNQTCLTASLWGSHCRSACLKSVCVHIWPVPDLGLSPVSLTTTKDHCMCIILILWNVY